MARIRAGERLLSGAFRFPGTGPPEDGLSCLPIFPVEAAVLDSLGHVGAADDLLARQVGDGAGDLEQAVIGPGRQPHEVESIFEELLCVAGERAEGFEQMGGDLGIAEQGGSGKAFLLHGPGLIDTLPYGGGALPGRFGGELLEFHRRHLDVQIDPVEQGSRHPCEIPLRRRRGAGAGPGGVPEIPTGAGIHPCPEFR